MALLLLRYQVFLEFGLDLLDLALVVSLSLRDLLLELYCLAHRRLQLANQVNILVLERFVLLLCLLRSVQVLLKLVYGLALQCKFALEPLELVLTGLVGLPKLKHLLRSDFLDVLKLSFLLRSGSVGFLEAESEIVDLALMSVVEARLLCLQVSFARLE